MKLVVGLWTPDTTSSAFASVQHAQRTESLSVVLERVKGRIATEKLDASQSVKGLVVCPEYSYAARNFGEKLHPSAIEGSRDSSLRRGREIELDDRQTVLDRLATLSDNARGIVIIPGTIAWRKRFDRTTNKRGDGSDEVEMARRQRQVQHLQHFQGQRTDRFESASSKPKFVSDYDGGRFRVDRPGYQEKIDAINAADVAKYYSRNTAYVFLDGRVIYSYHKHGDFFESISKNPDTIFVPSRKDPFRDIPFAPQVTKTFGFEICFDHEKGELKSAMSSSARAVKEVDFQIVCAASVKSNEANMCMSDGGYFIHADCLAENKIFRKLDGKIIRCPEEASDVDKLSICILDLDRPKSTFQNLVNWIRQK